MLAKILVETEKNAPSQNSYSSFAVVSFLSSQTGEELRLFNNVSQSVTESVRRRLTNLGFCEFFVFTLSSLSIVLVTRYCRYGFSVTERLVWSTLKGLFTCMFDVVTVKRLFTLVLISFFSGPFLLTLTIVSVDS